MGLRIALLVFVALVLGTPSGRARPPEVERAMRVWRRAVWEPDTTGFPESIPKLIQLAEDPRFTDDREVLFALAWAYRFVDEEIAARIAGRLRTVHPDVPELLVFDCFELQAAEREGEANEALERLVEHLDSPHAALPNAREIDVIVHLLLGSRYMDATKPEEVVEALEEARRLMRARGVHLPRWAITVLAEQHRALQQLGRAAEILAQAVEDDPGYAGHAYELARIYAVQHRDDDASLWYQKAQQLDPQFAPPYLKLAVMAFRADELDEMLRQLEGARELTSRQWAAYPDRRESGMAAELEAGLGLYWRAVGSRAAADGDGDAALEAYTKAMSHLEAALLDNPRCRRALVRLVEVGAVLEAPQAKMDGWKQLLDEIGRTGAGTAGGSRGRSFC